MSDHEQPAVTDDAAHDESAQTALPPAPPPFAARSGGSEWTIPVSIGIMQLAGLASIGAGAVHAGVAGLHAEHTTLTRLFIGAAVAQIAVGLLALAKGGRIAALLTAAVNLGAVAAWGITRLRGISWIDGLEEAEAAQFTDTATAALGGVATLGAIVALVGRRTAVSTVRLGLPAFSVGVMALAAMLASTNHEHSHAEADASAVDGTTLSADGGANAQPVAAADDGHSHGDEAEAAGAEHSHGDDAAATDNASDDGGAVQALSGAGAPAATDWPRPYDPAQPIDLSGVEGVTREQQLRATALIQQTLEELPAFADVETVDELGYVTIGDSSTGYEHHINYSLINDDVMLDPTQPESLVYRVDGEQRTLVSAMFIVPARPVDDPTLTDYAGRLIEWHVHDNLCWVTEGGLRVVGVTDAQGNCPEGTVQLGGENPMTHVWIVPHECGPFAALEGHGAGQAASDSGSRADQCSHEHDGAATEHAHDGEAATAPDGGGEAVGAAAAPSPEPVPYDPAMPIDLSGTPGVTPEQQAFAENLVSSTIRDLPQWADTATAEEAGFRSIGDAATGFEHYVQWDWINDEVSLDPDAPESLVYRVERDGSRTLASAMFMLPNDMTLEEVPDWGGALMQWHVHSDLCFDVSNPEEPRVGGLTDSAGGCTAPLVKLGEAPMIHVWITPHQCGPFAALEGVGAGQVVEGEEHLCDHAHGSD